MESRKTGKEFLETPVYALGGGTLVYTMSSREVASKGASLRLVRFSRWIHRYGCSPRTMQLLERGTD